MNRTEAWYLLCEYTKNENLRKHALAVEICVRAYARKFAEDEEKWSVVALLHDFDYEMYPNPPDHPLKGSEILEGKGVSKRRFAGPSLAMQTIPACRATRLLAKALFACDEVAGFITACSLVRPDRIASLEAKSVARAHEGQGLCALSEPRRHHHGRRGTGCSPGRAHHLLHCRHAGIAGQLGLTT